MLTWLELAEKISLLSEEQQKEFVILADFNVGEIGEVTFHLADEPGVEELESHVGVITKDPNHRSITTPFLLTGIDLSSLLRS